MNTVTRYLCSSVYFDWNLRKEVIELFNDKHVNLADPYRVDMKELFKHAHNAEKKTRNIYISLFILTVIFLILVFDAPLLAFGVFIVAAILAFIHDYTVEKVILRDVFKGSQNPDRIVKLSQKTLEKILAKRDQVPDNIICYGDFNPFVGSGIELENWSFTIDIDKGKKELGVILEPLDFEVNELNEYVRHSLEQLSFNLSTNDRWFINGKRIRENGFFLPDIYSHASVKVDNALLSTISKNSQECRFYNQITVYDWNDEIVLNIFLRFCKTQRSLFIEANHFLLLPIDEKYKKIDSMKYNLKLSEQVSLFFKSFFLTPYYCLISILQVLSYTADALGSFFNGGSEKLRLKEVKDNPNYNYGTLKGIRQMAAKNEYNELFQRLDKEMYAKTLEKRILSSIINFLEERNIDVSEFREREQSILNNGVIMTGGSMKAENIAVGKNAKTANFFRREQT